jgi:hypothetical protein
VPYPHIGRALVVAALATVAAMTVAAMTVAGCTSGSATGSSRTPTSTAGPNNHLASIDVPPPVIAKIPKLGTTDGLRLPIEAYRPTAAQQNVVDDAVEQVTGECMTQYGLTYTPTTSNLPDVHETAREYGIGDLATARKYGYHSATQTFTDKSKDDSAPPQAAGQLLVLTGSSTGADTTSGPNKATYHGKAIPDGGCSGLAQRAVTGADDIDPNSVPDSILVEMWKQSQSDTRVIAVIAAWSTCMKSAGFAYASPLDAPDDPAFTGPTPTAHEITTAVADMRCKQSTNLIGVWFTVESAYETAAITQQSAQVTTVREAWATASAKAAQMIGVTDPTTS